MKRQQRILITLFVGLFTLSTLIGCGAKRKRSLYGGWDTSSGINTIPTNNNDSSNSAVLRLDANPGTTVIVGQTISLFATYGSETRFDFSFVGIPPQGVSMMTTRLGVSRIEVTSTQSTVPFEVEVTPSGMASPSQRLELQFINDPNSSNLLASICNIQGPFAYSGENIPRVGSASIFGVSGENNEFARVTRVWTDDPTETASYYYSESNFYLVFRSPGTKTVYYEAEINPSYYSWNRSSTYCTGQTTVQVAPRQVYEHRDSCGINYVPFNSFETTCMGTGSKNTYFVYGNSCYGMSTPRCSNGNYYTGAFNSLSDCEASLRNGTCGNQASDVTTEQTVSLNARSTSWTNTGITVDTRTSLAVSVSGQIKYASGRFANPLGLNLSGFQRCKADGAKSFNNMAVIGKIGVNGTPFLVGTYVSRASSSANETGTLYLAINDMNCAADNGQSFTAVITKTVHAR